MIQLAKLYEELQKFPEDALAYAYEGEDTGIVIVDENRIELGFIPCEDSAEEDGPTVID